MEYTGSNSVYAVALKSGGTFSVDEITVDKVLFSGIGNFNIAAGIAIESPDTEQVINYISATNITANATSSTGHFDGIFLNNSKLKEGVNGINVANIHADNVKTYGLNVTEQDLNSNSINIEKVSSIKEDTYGMQIRSGNDSTKSGSNIGTVNIKNVTSQNKSAYGFYLNKYSNNIYNNDAIANINNLTVNGVSGSDDYCTIDVNATNDGTILNVENAYINNENATGYNGAFADKADENKEKMNDIALCVVDGAVANWDNEEGTYYLNGTIVAGAGKNNSDNGGKINISGNDVNIFGDVFAGNGGEVNITLNANNVLEGQVDDYHEINEDNNLVFHNSAFVNSSGAAVDVTSAGTATLNINDGGKWIARGQSFVDTISLDGGIIDMSKNENSSVTVENLKGEGGQFIMRLDTGNHTNSDMLYVTGTFEGNHELIIDSDEFVASEITENNPLRFATIKGDVNVENMKARVTDAGFFNNTYNITKEQFDDMDTDNVTYNGSGNGQGSYKPGNDVVTSTFDEDDVNLLITAEGKQSQISDAGQTIINMSRANYSNAIYMDRLNKRMGEARYISPEDEQGMWVRLRHDRIGKEDAFRSQNTMYEMGYDVKQDCDNGDRRVGFAIDYMDGKTEYRNVAGDGDIKRYGLWLYDTWMGDKGHYADYVLKWGHLENDFDIYNSRGKVNGDYSNNVFSVSAEYGKKNDMGNDWYFEPALTA